MVPFGTAPVGRVMLRFANVTPTQLTLLFRLSMYAYVISQLVP